MQINDTTCTPWMYAGEKELTELWYFNNTPPMRFRLSRHLWLFRLSSLTGGELRSSAGPSYRLRPTFHTGLPVLFARKLTMQSSGNVTSSSSYGEEGAEQPGPGLFRPIPSITTEEVGPPPADNTRVATLVVNERKLRTPSPQCGGNDYDSEAESYRDGRTEGVDRDTRGRAFAWCRDFLAGSWKTIDEADFQISIVR